MNLISGGDENTFSITHLAMNRQDTFKDAFTDIHKVVLACAGGDISDVNSDQLIFPEIDTMSEKTKAETYVLKVGANLCSRRTASMNMGHNWEIERQQIIEESENYLVNSYGVISISKPIKLKLQIIFKLKIFNIIFGK